MFQIKNLRKERHDGWAYLKCDFDVTGETNPFNEDSMWIAVEEKNETLLNEDVYDAFVLVPLILGMYYHQDVHISGNISPRLYNNIQHYLIPIFDNFSEQTTRIKFTVDGFDFIKEAPGDLIGTGISCGVDSLTTIYDNFIHSEMEDFKINSLFFVNCGTHGDYENERTMKRWKDRSNLNKNAAIELGLDMYLVNSNLHAFTHKIGEEKIGYLAIYSCLLACQRRIKRYYVSGNISYDEIAEFYKLSKDFDISEYAESYYPHLISTERFELVIDGCQYTRAEKTERISDWEFAQKHLNVCVTPLDDGRNCSCCNKCMWTLIPLEAMGKLDLFDEVFDIDKYKKNAFKWKCKFIAHQGKDSMETSIMRYVRKKGMDTPPVIIAKARTAAGTLKSSVMGK